MTGTVFVEVPLDVRVELAHAALTRTQGARVLHLKGPVVRAQYAGLPAGRTSGDADVLVHPDDAAGLLATLAADGWVRPSAATGAGGHAVVLWHPTWQVTADVHLHFPGVGVAPTAAFDVLWSRRSSVVLGGVRVPCPGRDDHGVLLLLHAARGGGSARARDDVRIVAAEFGSLGARGAERLAAAAASLRCEDALSVVLPGQFRPTSAAGQAHWRLRAEGAPGVSIWLSRISASGSLRERLLLGLHAVFPGRAALAQRHGRALRPAELGAAWGRRLLRGTTELRSGWRRYRLARRPLAATADSAVPPRPRTTPQAAAPSVDVPVEVLEVVRPGALYLAAVPHGPVLRLEGEARAIGRGWQEGRAVESLAEAAADRAGLPVEEVRPAVLDVVDLLRDLGITGQPSR